MLFEEDTIINNLKITKVATNIYYIKNNPNYSREFAHASEEEIVKEREEKM